ncbi:MAG: sigma-54-dependent transcriptional regulator [Rhodospirillales bacterium]
MFTVDVDDFTVRVAAIGRDAVSLELAAAALKGLPVRVDFAAGPQTGLELVSDARPEIVLLDVTIPGVNGSNLLERILDAAPETEVILIAEHYSAEAAVGAIEKGAADYMAKPLSASLLARRCASVVEELRQRRAALELDAEVLKAHRFEGLAGRSPVMLQVFARIRRAAPHFRTALITGAPGTGKDLAALALHNRSEAPQGSFTVYNCLAGAPLPDVIAEDARGGGTLFLDEVGDMPVETQGKLLDALERSPNFKVIAATNCNLRDRVAKKQFREDLYRLLSKFEIRLPPLADRKEDLPLLVRCFLEEFSRKYGKVMRGITPRAQLALARYSWPGNVGELRGALESACMAACGDTVDLRDLPESVRNGAGAEGILTLAEVERRYVRRVLESVDGNKARAARLLGINRATVYRILKEKTTAAGA